MQCYCISYTVCWFKISWTPTCHTQTDILTHEQRDGAIKSQAMRELLCRRDGEVGGCMWEVFFKRMKRNNGGEGNEKRRKGERKAQKEGEMEVVIYLAVER